MDTYSKVYWVGIVAFSLFMISLVGFSIGKANWKMSHMPSHNHAHEHCEPHKAAHEHSHRHLIIHDGSDSITFKFLWIEDTYTVEDSHHEIELDSVCVK